MTEDRNPIVYQARLHWIIFFWPFFFLCSLILTALAIDVHAFRLLFWFGAAFVSLWAGLMAITYHCSYLLIKKKQVILCTGFLVRQTLDVSLDKIESIDIRQTLFGTLFHYGSLTITGTGGTRSFVHYIDKPLTCRRYIEDMMHRA